MAKMKSIRLSEETRARHPDLPDDLGSLSIRMPDRSTVAGNFYWRVDTAAGWTIDPKHPEAYVCAVFTEGSAPPGSRQEAREIAHRMFEQLAAGLRAEKKDRPPDVPPTGRPAPRPGPADRARAMPSRFDWKEEDYHPPDLCFFCKRRTEFTSEFRTLYRATGGGELDDGEEYARAFVRIPGCKECVDPEPYGGPLGPITKVIAYVLAAAIVTYAFRTYVGTGMTASIVFGVLFGIALQPVVWFTGMVILTVLDIRFWRPGHRIAGADDYPVVVKLKSMGWLGRLPDDGSTGYDASARARYAEHQMEVDGVMASFSRWTREQSRTRGSGR